MSKLRHRFFDSRQKTQQFDGQGGRSICPRRYKSMTCESGTAFATYNNRCAPNGEEVEKMIIAKDGGYAVKIDELGQVALFSENLRILVGGLANVEEMIDRMHKNARLNEICRGEKLKYRKERRERK